MFSNNLLMAAAGSGFPNAALIDVLTDLSLTTNLIICLDAGDADSYDGTEAAWQDVSGNGHHFNRGTSSSSEDIDPVFNGVAGGISNAEYFESDGDAEDNKNEDQFVLASGTKPSAIEDMHKDGALCSLIVGYKRGEGSGAWCCFKTNQNSPVYGAGFGLANNGTLALFVSGTNNVALSATTDDTLDVTVGHFAGLSIDEPTGAGGGFFYADGDYLQVSASDTWDATYSSPSSGTALETPRLFAYPLGHYSPGYFSMPNGAQANFFALWSGSVLTKSNMDDIYARMKGRILV